MDSFNCLCFFGSQEPSEIRQNSLQSEQSVIPFEFGEQSQPFKFVENSDSIFGLQQLEIQQDQFQPQMICTVCRSDHPLTDKYNTHSCSYALFLRMKNLIQNDPYYKIEENQSKLNFVLKKNQNMFVEMSSLQNKNKIKQAEKKIKKYLTQIIQYEKHNYNPWRAIVQCEKTIIKKFICPKCSNQYETKGNAQRHMQHLCFASEANQSQKPQTISEIVETKYCGK